MKTLLLILIILWFFSVLRSLFKKRTLLKIPLLISMMFFGGIGFALGDYYLDSEWAIYGAVFGVLIGIELKEKFFQVIRMVYNDILEK